MVNCFFLIYLNKFAKPYCKQKVNLANLPLAKFQDHGPCCATMSKFAMFTYLISFKLTIGSNDQHKHLSFSPYEIANNPTHPLNYNMN